MQLTNVKCIHKVIKKGGRYQILIRLMRMNYTSSTVIFYEVK